MVLWIVIKIYLKTENLFKYWWLTQLLIHITKMFAYESDITVLYSRQADMLSAFSIFLFQ